MMMMTTTMTTMMKKRMNKIRNMAKGAKGFTFAEILICVALIAFIMVGIYEVLIVAQRSWHTDTGMVDLQQGSRKAMDAMTREIRQSASSQVDIDGSEITFKMIEPDGDDWLDEDIKYYLDSADANEDGKSSQILREYPDGEYQVVADDIDTLSFCFLQDDGSCEEGTASDIVRIQLKARKTVYSGEVCFPSPCDDDSRVLQEKVVMRNE